MKHAFFFDIDGTLYDNQFHEFSEGLLEEFDYLRKNHHADLYLLSSRSPFETIHLPDAFLDYPYAGIVLEGGAAIYGRNQSLIDAWLIPNEDIKKIHEFCRDKELLWRYSGPDGNYFNSRPDENTRLHWRKLYLTCPITKEWQGDDVCNILIWTSTKKQQQEIQELLPESSLVIYPDCVEIRARNISKENAVKVLKKNLNYEKVICVGDGPNDVEMLKAADYSLAVGNACEEAREAADEIIPAVYEGGVAKWLKERREKEEKHATTDN